MKKSYTAEQIPNLAGLGNVFLQGYSYYKKMITPGELLNLSGAYLKCSNLYPHDAVLSAEYVLEALEFLKSEAEVGGLKLEDELDFVILHMAGECLLLLPTTWQKSNEMWESIYLKKVSQAEGYVPLKFENDHKGTYSFRSLAWSGTSGMPGYVFLNPTEMTKQSWPI